MKLRLDVWASSGIGGTGGTAVLSSTATGDAIKDSTETAFAIWGVLDLTVNLGESFA